MSNKVALVTGGDFAGERGPAERAKIIVELATLPDDGPTGGFFDEHGPIDW